MSLKTIHLHGQLGALYGEMWYLEVATPAEAVTAINANCPGFTQYLMESERDGTGYRILLEDTDIEPEALLAPFSARETFHIVPVLAGSGQTGMAVAKVVVGAIIAIASAGAGVAALAADAGMTMGEVALGGGIGMAMSQTALLGMSYGTIALLGTSIMFSGVSSLLAKTPEAAGTKDGSFAFNGPVNTTSQGGPIPIGYGELVVGSIVISGGIQVTNEAIL
jgi:predicted phage tail protein